MSLAAHLSEARRRLVVSAVAVLAGTVVGWAYYPEVYHQLALPFEAYQLSSGDASLVALNFGNATAAFSQQVNLGIFVGVIVSSPVWLYQVWAFVVPGLTKKERWISLAFLAAVVPLFLGGCAFAYVTLPKALTVLFGLTPAGASNIQQVSDYFAFVMRFILSFGLAFLLPVFLVSFVGMGVFTGRQLRSAWRAALLGIFVAAAIITPTPDPFTMMLLGGPLALLYFGAVGVGLIIDRRRRASRPAWLAVPDTVASPL